MISVFCSPTNLVHESICQILFCSSFPYTFALSNESETLNYHCDKDGNNSLFFQSTNFYECFIC